MSRLAYAITVAFLLLCSCSPVQRIAVNANEIRNEARALAEHGLQVGDPVVIEHAGKIDDLAAGIQVSLPGVEDKTPAWLSTLRWWGIAAAAIAVLIVLWQSGALMGLRVLIGWLPRKKVTQAELAVDMLDPSRPEGDREYVAAMRAQDPVFDAAFRKAQERRKTKT